MATVDSFFVTRTMQTVELLAFQSCTAPQVAEVLRVDARTARRLLNRLTDEGWLVRSEGRVRTYALSLRVLALAAQFAERAPLTLAAAPIVREVHERTGGVAHLVVPCYRSVLCLVHRDGHTPSRPHLRELVPAHASAGGKVLLAHRAAWRESVLELPLERLTERTVVDPDAVRRECEITLAQGFASEDGEYRDGLQGVAAPVPDPSGEVMAAIALTAPGEVPVGDVLAAATVLREKLVEAGEALAA